MSVINVVIYEPEHQRLVHANGTVAIPAEVLAQAEDGDVVGLATQFARKLQLLDHRETLWVAA